MESNSSSESGNTSYDDELDTSFIDGFASGLNIKKEERFNNRTIVFFSLDTTDRNTKISEILRIAAGCRGNNGVINNFEVFMKPKKYGIGPTITVNKGYKMGANGNLLLGGNQVEARTQKEGLEMFLNFLSDQSGETGSVLLAAHACVKIRRPVLLRHMAEYKLLPRCQELVEGFIDTSTVFKSRLRGHVTNFGLKNLTITYLGVNRLRTPQLADATVQALLDILNHRDVNCTDDILMEYGSEYNFNLYSLKYDFENLVSPTILKNIASAGISSARLQTEFRDNNGDVSNLLRTVTVQNVIEIINARLLAMSNAN